MQFKSSLLRTSTSSPSWIFEGLASVPKVVMDLFSSTTFVVGERTSGIQSRSLRAKTRNLEIQNGEDVGVLFRLGSNDFELNIGYGLLAGYTIRLVTGLLSYILLAVVICSLCNKNIYDFSEQLTKNSC